MCANPRRTSHRSVHPGLDRTLFKELTGVFKRCVERVGFCSEHAWDTMTKSRDLREAIPDLLILLELHPRPPAISLLGYTECDEVAVQFDEALKSHSWHFCTSKSVG